MIDMRELRGWVLSARIAMPGKLNRDSRIAEVVYVIGRRVQEICGHWPFPDSEMVHPPSIDCKLSFNYAGKVDNTYGFGPEAYAYCNRYTLDNVHLWPRIGREVAEAHTCGVVIHSPVDDPSGLI